MTFAGGECGKAVSSAAEKEEALGKIGLEHLHNAEFPCEFSTEYGNSPRRRIREDDEHRP